MPMPKIDGQWFMEGNPGLPCAIFQTDLMLLIINEKGDIATGRFLTDKEFITIASPAGWQVGLKGELADNLHTIAWRNSTIWRR